jgi:type I restriction enzyme, S subunit
MGHGANQKNLSADILRTVTISYPNTVTEQDSIIRYLESVDDKVQEIRKRLVLLSDLFRTLLYKLMTGEMRVRNTDLPDVWRATAA